MSEKKLAKLREIFESLNCDLEIGLAYAIADKLNIIPQDVFREYEAWQIE